MLDTLLLLSGNDIPFSKARLTIHQPTLKEIGYIGEENFFIGCELLTFSKDDLTPEDQKNLKDKSEFEILINILDDKHNADLQRQRIGAAMVLTLLFPTLEMRYNVQKKEMLFVDPSIEDEQAATADAGRLTEDNFSDFRSILDQIFVLRKAENEYNPQSKEAQRIADKIKEGHRQKAERAPAEKKRKHFSVFSVYMSILAVGEQLSLMELNNYTIYQLYDVFERYEAKVSYDMYIQAKMAGAKNIKTVDNWMRDLHNEE